jgi:acyl dehydratase
MRIAFDELTVGRRFVGPGRTLTETDHGLFMMLVGDWHPIHADADYARTTPFGQRVMHGSFGIALAMGMLGGLFEHDEPIIGALGLAEWQFRAPLFLGDTVHLEMEVVGTRRTSSGDKGIVERKLELIKRDGTVAQSGRSAVMLRLAAG